MKKPETIRFGNAIRIKVCSEHSQFENIITIKQYIIDLIDKDPRDMIFDISDSHYVTSGIMNIMILLSKTLARLNRRFCIFTGANKYSLDVLDVVGLSRVLTTFKSEDEVEEFSHEN